MCTYTRGDAALCALPGVYVLKEKPASAAGKKFHVSRTDEEKITHNEPTL